MNVQIKWVYAAKKGEPLVFLSEWLKATDALTLSFDIEKTGRVKELFFVDELKREWTQKQMKKLLVEIEGEVHDLSVYFDANYNKEEQLAGLGVVIYYEKGKKAYRKRKNEAIDLIESNNEAEYAAFYFALQQLEELGVHDLPVSFYGDSLVVINQLSGEWPVFEQAFVKWIEKIEFKMKHLGIHPHYYALERLKNKEANQLAKQALNGEEVSSCIERKE